MAKEELKEELQNRIIPYWEKLKDNENGGYYGYVNYNLEIDSKAEKGGILNSRILWFFSSAYVTLKEANLLEDAKHAYEFLRDKFIDRENGGIYWSLNYDGSVKDSMKHTYCQSFAIYGLTAYYEASKDDEALRLAMELFEIIEDRCVDSYGYLEAFTKEWKYEDNEKLSENGLLAAKTMNTILHVMEAYTELYKISKNENVKAALIKILSVFNSQIYNADKEILEVFFDEKMKTIADLNSYGHDIEASWLLDRACDVIEDDRNDVVLKIRRISNVLSERIFERAVENSSVLNECFNGVVDTARVWWVQAESMVGFYNKFQKCGDKKYFDLTCEIWGYIKENFIDKRAGSEWFWDVDNSGKPVSKKPITEPWKCPYHNGRMCLEIIRRMQ